MGSNRAYNRKLKRYIKEDTEKRERLTKLFQQYSDSPESLAVLQNFIDNKADSVPYVDILGNETIFILRRAQHEWLDRAIQVKMLEYKKENPADLIDETKRMIDLTDSA